MSDLGYLMERRREAGGGGAGMSELGFMLGGGGAARRQQIFNQAASQSALMQDRLAQARQRQQDEIEKDYQRSQRRSAQSEIDKKDHLGALLYGGGEKYGEVTKAQEEAQGAQFQKDAWEARNGDPNALNRMLMVINKKPVEFQHTLGEGQYTPNAYDTTSQPVVSDIGRAIIGEKGAQAGAANAAASQHIASADAERALADQRRGKGTGASTKPLTDKDLSMLIGDPIMDEKGQPELDAQRRPVYVPNRNALNDFMSYADKNNTGLTPKAWSEFHNSFGNVDSGSSTGAAPEPHQRKKPAHLRSAKYAAATSSKAATLRIRQIG
jgi:hypothetical protein